MNNHPTQFLLRLTQTATVERAISIIRKGPPRPPWNLHNLHPPLHDPGNREPYPILKNLAGCARHLVFPARALPPTRQDFAALDPLLFFCQAERLPQTRRQKRNPSGPFLARAGPYAPCTERSLCSPFPYLQRTMAASLDSSSQESISSQIEASPVPQLMSSVMLTTLDSNHRE